MTEKTIWPEWKRKEHGLPGIPDYNKERNIFAYAGKQAWVCSFSIPDLEVSTVSFWAVAPDNAFRDFHHNDHIATPEECEARKKELSRVSMGTVTHKDDPMEKVLNPWVPGNEPEKEGSYEITWKEKIGLGQVDVGHYSNNMWFADSSLDTENKLEETNILAHKFITLSDPYVPPEPERKIRCPFCNSKENTFEAHFECKPCGAKIPYVSKKRLFELYDKLNN